MPTTLPSRPKSDKLVGVTMIPREGYKEEKNQLIKKMAFKSIVREFKEMKQGIGKRGANMRLKRNRGVAPESCQAPLPVVQQTQWADLPTELLLDIIQRLEASETSWPARRDVVACAAVCKSWREITKEVVQTPEKCGLLTFPISLKQPGTREHPIQCFIKRERETSTYRLYLGLSPCDADKMLLAARKTRRATSTSYAISLTANDFSRSSNAYVGKLRSNFLGTKFTVYDSQPSQEPAAKSTRHSHKRVQSCHACSNGYASHYNNVTVAYELNVLRTRGPRRIRCIMHSIPLSSIQEGGTAPTPTSFRKIPEEDFFPWVNVPKGKKPSVAYKSESVVQVQKEPPLILKNKAPRWHEQLQCWCLNFKGRVTVASVKNFQLAAAVDSSGQDVNEEEQEKVILQFGKIGKDVFTMDYRYPLSAFQAFAICLSSFDTKPACE